MIYFDYAPNQNDFWPCVLWDNLVDSVTASSTATGYPTSNTLTESTYDFWRAGTTDTLTLTPRFDSSTVWTCVCINGHNFSGMTVDILGKTITPTDNSPIVVFFKEKTSTFVTIRISGATVAPQVTNLWVGRPLVFPCGIQSSYTPLWLASTVELLVSTSMNGHHIGNRVINKGASTTIPLNAVERWYLEDKVLPFRDHYNNGKAFWFMASPLNYRNDLGYCWRSGDPMTPSFDGNGNFMSLSMEVTANL